MIIDNISSFMYSKLLVIILIGAGVYFTIRTSFPQVRLFHSACKAGMEMSMLWNISDVLMGVMAIINVPVILILSNTAMKALKDYERQLKMGMNPVFKSKDIGMKEKLDCWK